MLKEKKKGKTKEPNGTYVEFIPDTEIFKKFRFQKELILKRLWHYAYLNTGLTLLFNGETIWSEHGLLDLLNEEVKEDRLYEPLHYRGKHARVCISPLIRAMARLIFLSSTANIPKTAEPTSLPSAKGF